MESKTKKNIFLITLKIFISSILLAIILRKTGLQNILARFRMMDLRFFLLASALHVLVVSIAALRWGLFLDRKYPLKKLLSLYFIGSFFNTLLPGAVGGDALKVYYVYRDTHKGGGSFASVFLDRYMGMMALFTIGLASGLAGYHTLKSIGTHLVVPLIFITFIAGSFIFFKMRIGGGITVVQDFYRYIDHYLNGNSVLLKAFLLSLLIQALSIASTYVIALGLGLKLPFLPLCVFVAIITTITAIPISISGIGVREAVYVALLGLIGVPAGTSASISLLWFLSKTAASLPGFVEFVRYRISPADEFSNG